METRLEHILTNSYKAVVVSHLNSHPEDFEEAIKLAVSEKQPYSWRAAWAVWSCMENNDPRIKRYIKKIINVLTICHDNQLRELLIILRQMELNEEDEGRVFNVCVDVWEKINKKPSVRFNAFRLIVKIAKKHPDLLNEVKILTQDHYLDSLSAGVRKSVYKMMGKR